MCTGAKGCKLVLMGCGFLVWTVVFWNGLWFSGMDTVMYVFMHTEVSGARGTACGLPEE